MTLRERYENEFGDPDLGYDLEEGKRLHAFAGELLHELERCQAADSRPEWGTRTELGAADRDPNTRG